MSEQNKNQNNEIAEIEETQVAVIVEDHEDYIVKKDEKGKFVRKAKYAEFNSIVPETKADKVWLFNLMDGDEDSGNGLKEHVGKHIQVQHVITRKYDKINEETGELEYGVLTYLITPDRIAYITSSKSVYFTINNLMKIFGEPGKEGWEDMTVQVGKKKGTNGDAITIKLVG